ncbi:hypothetical protein Tco_0729165 [Tanacetum coccineum]|uniref:Uncharacterized protein n=1 Tax=Tanacetum coccineum TaxID=301880 RepID=A0ABQ4YN48_9ASTR
MAVDVTALIEQMIAIELELEKIESLKAQLRSKEPCFTSDYVKPKVLAPGMYAIDVKPIPHPLKNNRRRTGHAFGIWTQDVQQHITGSRSKLIEFCGNVHRGNFGILILKWPSESILAFGGVENQELLNGLPRPIYVMVIPLKWIYKVKLDEYGDVLKTQCSVGCNGISSGGGGRKMESKCFYEWCLRRSSLCQYLKDYEVQDNPTHVLSPEEGLCMGLASSKGRGRPLS